MTWILIGIYIATHFLLYVLIFRHLQRFRTERGIFSLHFLSASILLFSMVAHFLLLPTYNRFALILGAAAAHGIYSLSFLECWALSEGGYSLRVLSEIVRRGTVPVSDLERHFVELSAQKKKDRASSLMTLGLICVQDERYTLTTKGKMIACTIAAVATLADFRVRG
jgi:hypothetical protein